MRAAVYHGARDVRVEEVREPPPPGRDEVAIAVHRAGICGTDSSEYAAGPKLIPVGTIHPVSGRVAPLVLGHEFAGRVVAVGEDVDSFRPGDRAVSGAGISCGTCQWCRAGRTNLCANYYTLGLQADGGLAERVNAPVSSCLRVPENCSDEAAAMAQPLAVAIHAIRRSGVGAGETIAVIGIGGIGSFIVTAAAARRAGSIIAIDIDTQRLEAAKKLGATVLVNAAEEDATRRLLAETAGEGAHVTVEASGAPEAVRLSFATVRRGGRVLMVGLHGEPRSLNLQEMTLQEVDLVTSVAHVANDDLPEALELLATDRIAPLVLGSVIPLEAIVEEGLVPLARGQASGKIIVDTLSAT